MEIQASGEGLPPMQAEGMRSQLAKAFRSQSGGWAFISMTSRGSEARPYSVDELEAVLGEESFAVFQPKAFAMSLKTMDLGSGRSLPYVLVSFRSTELGYKVNDSHVVLFRAALFPVVLKRRSELISSLVSIDGRFAGTSPADEREFAAMLDRLTWAVPGYTVLTPSELPGARVALTVEGSATEAQLSPAPTPEPAPSLRPVQTLFDGLVSKEPGQARWGDLFGADPVVAGLLASAAERRSRHRAGTLVQELLDEASARPEDEKKAVAAVVLGYAVTNTDVDALRRLAAVAPKFEPPFSVLDLDEPDLSALLGRLDSLKPGDLSRLRQGAASRGLFELRSAKDSALLMKLRPPDRKVRTTRKEGRELVAEPGFRDLIYVSTGQTQMGCVFRATDGKFEVRKITNLLDLACGRF